MRAKSVFAWMMIVTALFALLAASLMSVMLGARDKERGTTDDYHLYYSASMAGEDWRDYRSPFSPPDGFFA